MFIARAFGVTKPCNGGSIVNLLMFLTNIILKPSLSTVDNALALPNICMSWIMVDLSYQSAAAPKVDEASPIFFGDSTLNSYQSGIFGPSHGVARWNSLYDSYRNHSAKTGQQ